MEDKLQKVPSGLPATPQQPQFRQDGNENVMVSSYMKMKFRSGWILFEVPICRPTLTT